MWEQKSVVSFWTDLEETKNFNGTLLFLNIAKIVNAILIIPHGNADVERVFSNMLDIKTKKRNKMSAQMLSDLLRIKLDLKQNKDCCTTYNFSDKHFSRMGNIYKSSKDDVKLCSDSDIESN